MNKMMVKSCPFCDSLNVHYDEGMRSMMCGMCGATGPRSPQNAVRQTQRAVSTWNVRLGGGRPTVEMARVEDDGCWEQAVAPRKADVTFTVSPEDLQHVSDIFMSMFDHRRMTKK